MAQRSSVPVDQVEEVFDILTQVGGANPRGRKGFLESISKEGKAKLFLHNVSTTVIVDEERWTAQQEDPTSLTLKRVNEHLDMAFRKFN